MCSTRGGMQAPDGCARAFCLRTMLAPQGALLACGTCVVDGFRARGGIRSPDEDDGRVFVGEMRRVREAVDHLSESSTSSTRQAGSAHGGRRHLVGLDN